MNPKISINKNSLLIILCIHLANLIQVNANDCTDHPCLNGGECLLTKDGNKCNCTMYYTGSRCQIRTPYCDPTHCLNGGSCYHARSIEFREPSCFCKSMKKLRK